MTRRSKGRCKLCLKTLYDNTYKVLEGDDTKILEVLLLQVDVESMVLICFKCMKILQKCFEFKSCCLYVEDYISPFIKNGVKIDLGKVLRENVNIDNDNDIKLCRLCIDIVKDDTCKQLDETDSQNLVDDIRNCLPELNLNAVCDSLICEKCINCIEEHRELQKKCKFLNNFCEQEKSRKLNVSGNCKEENTEQEEKFHDLQETDCNAKDNEYEEQSIEDCNIKTELEMDEINNAVNTEHVKFEDITVKDEPLETVTFSGSSTLQREISDEYTSGKTNQNDQNKSNEKKDKTPVLEYKYSKSNRKYQCTLCNYKTKYKSSVVRHMTIHLHPSERETFKCDLCNFTTYWRHVIKLHGLVHKDISEIKMYKCTGCGFKTKRNQQLKQHQSNSCKANINDSTKRIHKCPICKFDTKYKASLNNHMMTHLDPSEKKMYKCAVCNYATDRKYRLKSHVLVHEDITERDTKRIHKCSICNYNTKYKGNLKGHMMTHLDPSEKKMYKCDVCNYTTDRKDTLKRHGLIHKDISTKRIHKMRYLQFQH